MAQKQAKTAEKQPVSAPISPSQGAAEPWRAQIAPGLHTLVLPISGLTEDPENVRSHDERSIDSIAASLQRFMQRKPVVVQQEGMVVRAGNGTLVAAKRLGWTHLAAIVVHETDVEAAAYAIADNRTAELSEWDVPRLMEMIDSAKVDLAQFPLGFSLDELESLRGAEGWAEMGDELMSSNEPEPAKNAATVIKVYIKDFTLRDEVTAALNAFFAERFPRCVTTYPMASWDKMIPLKRRGQA